MLSSALRFQLRFKTQNLKKIDAKLRYSAAATLSYFFQIKLDNLLVDFPGKVKLWIDNGIEKIAQNILRKPSYKN